MAKKPVQQTAQTQVLETLDAKSTTAAKLVEKTGRPLSNPIQGKQEGDEFDVTLTGKIEIREFQGTKGAYFTTKQGFSIRVNASFDPAVHKEGAKLKAVCRVLPADVEQGRERDIKYCTLAD